MNTMDLNVKAARGKRLIGLLLVLLLATVPSCSSEPVLVGDAHSDNPKIEAFYREIDVPLGMAQHITDEVALDMAKDVCDGVNLIVMGDRDVTDEFAAAARRICTEL